MNNSAAAQRAESFLFISSLLFLSTIVRVTKKGPSTRDVSRTPPGTPRQRTQLPHPLLCGQHWRATAAATALPSWHRVQSSRKQWRHGTRGSQLGAKTPGTFLFLFFPLAAFQTRFPDVRHRSPHTTGRRLANAEHHQQSPRICNRAGLRGLSPLDGYVRSAKLPKPSAT